ncbi:Alpha/Beta hydrolase protein [Apodospora peruviana]|uniref:Alpha/Beta hydrolase protein n=1 Tax=Apodospora peruviana TaxID=516989 RepID=A0AAE0M478_9PEZI|nr:Alpha/Beta hydrolase protein [Apodospora peruviana]
MSCPDCFKGHVHEGEPKGKTTKLYDLDTYVIEPSPERPPKGIIVIIPDAFGWDFVNNRILADHYAQKGDYLVYLPDFMRGHSAPLSMLDSVRKVLEPGNMLAKPYHVCRALSGAIPMMVRNSIGKSHPIVKDFFVKLRKDQLEKKDGSGLPIGAAGFCWGGKHALLLARRPPAATASAASAAADQKTAAATAAPEPEPLLIDAVFTGHPSYMQIPEDVEHLAIPVSFAIGEKDAQLGPDKAEKIKSVVEALPGQAKGEVRVYKNCAHGFCVRADLSFKDSEVAQQAAEAEDQCIAWFDKYLKPVGTS